MFTNVILHMHIFSYIPLSIQTKDVVYYRSKSMLYTLQKYYTGVKS